MNFKQAIKAVISGMVVCGVGMDLPAKGHPILPVVAGVESPHRASQQQLTVRGVVTSSLDGSPLLGVSVAVKGTSRGVGTNEEGQFVLEDVPGDAVLVFTMVGHSTMEVPLNNRSTVDVVMEATMSDLDEVVVVGYGVQKKVTKTGSVSQVKGEDLKQAPVVNVENTLVGRIPGVMALNQGGEPGYDGSRILIRGRNTLNANNAGPLIVIDGIPDRGGMGRLDANDIESVSVLKDASAAIYGSRSANGVILITTKRGVTGEPRISYNYNQGFVTPTKLPEMADAALYSQLQNEILEYGGDPIRWSEEDIQKFRDGSDPWRYPNSDWIEELISPSALQNKHSLSIRGGTEKVKYYASLGSLFQDGIYRNSATKYKQQNARINLDTKIGEHLDVRMDMAGRLEGRNFPPRSAGSIFRAAMRGRPNEAARWPNGLPGPDIEYGDNPVVTSTNEIGYDRHDRWVLNGTLGATFRVPGVEGLSFDGNFGIDKMLNFQKRWIKPWTLYTLDGFDADGEPILSGAQRGVAQPELYESFYQDQTITINASARYERSFGNHNINLLAAIEQIEGLGDNFNGQRKYFMSSAIDQMFAGGELERSITGSGYENARRNYFGRVSYNFSEKYLLDFNWRVDGSQRFPKDHRFGFFPGVGAGWVISGEDFWKNNVPLVNHFKLRGSYGQLGSDLIPDFQYLSTFGFTTGIIVGDALSRGINQTRTPNPNIRWELSENYNVGVELELDNGKWALEADWFMNNRSNILTQRSASLPLYVGFGLPDENIGTSTNRGVEGVVSFRNVFGDDFYLDLSANAMYARNKLTFWDETPGAPEYQRSTGKTFGAPLYYEAIGIFSDDAHVESYPHISGARAGDVIFRDVNDDGVIDDLDRIRYDYTEFPRWTYGFTLQAEYKDFDLTMLWQGAAGARQYVRTESGLIGNFPLAFVEDRWTPDNTDATWPRTYDREREYWANRANTFWWWKTDYLRLKTIEVGYTLPQTLTKKAAVSSLRLFASGQNLLTFSKVDFFDPEIPGGSAQYYPQTKVYNVGLSMNF
ncbi:SusC/RagA family TonB-linked outer membrane protein [Parapedobacter sp. 2B3]|uniref:SusC/RagA family TonB-linked outer membrane protein n=1 Tax=Parapedobacter sp. 2B3 TaxID=3342381 RepID=UPI0035B6125B